MPKFIHYIRALRLHTLPLSVSGTILGAMLAASDGYFNWTGFLLGILTVSLLQILINLSNKLGELSRGTGYNRIKEILSPLQAGVLTKRDYRMLILLFIPLALLSGCILATHSFFSTPVTAGIVCLILGGILLLTFLSYTLGRRSYAYGELRDLAAFLFFGVFCTLGSYYLMWPVVPDIMWLPACAMGCLATGVVNINNMRDVYTDYECGKRTLPTRLGEEFAVVYQFILLTAAWGCLVAYTILHPNKAQGYLYIVTLPAFGVHLLEIYRLRSFELDLQVDILNYSILIFAVLAGTGQLC